MTKNRESFSSVFVVFLATLSSAIGLGNIWRFPYLVGENGGGAFVLIYLVCVILVGIPIMVGEFYIGRRSRSNPVGAFEKLKSHKAWSLVGFIGMIGSFFILFFYSSVAGYVYKYLFKTLKGDFSQLRAYSSYQALEVAKRSYETSILGTSPMLWQGIVIFVVAAVLIMGVKNGIERIAKTLMPLLFILIIICDISALALPTAGAGLKFMLVPEFSKINQGVVLSALGLAFFKLALGVGTMMIYGSYFTDETNLVANGYKVALTDVLVSLLAGVAIFPVVFFYGLEPAAGPGLLFEIIPLAFITLPLGNILLAMFFALSAIAATTAMISMCEVPVAIFKEQFNISRTKAVLIASLITLVIGVLSVHPSSLFGSDEIMGKSFYEWFDFLSSNLLLPFNGLLISIFIGYKTKKEELFAELSNYGKLNNRPILLIYYYFIRYVTPLLTFIILLSCLGIIKIGK